jgi:hypothetical protein
MHSGRTLFSQLMNHLPLHEFHNCVDRYGGDYKIKSFSCLDQFYCMAFAQLTYRESLRDIEACLRSQPSKLYHMGIRGNVSRNTLANANAVRDWRIYADFAYILIGMARELYRNDDFGVELNHTIYAFDSTIIDLCLTLFPWARFRQGKAAVKMHTLLDLRGSIPTFIEITDGILHDLHGLDCIPVEAGAFYILDRGYTDFRRLSNFSQRGAYFVVRSRQNMKFARQVSRPVDKASGVLCDQTIVLTGVQTATHNAGQLRRIKYFDAESQKKLVFITNQFFLPALIVAQLYKSRWKIELFFKWLKQHLRIKAFYGLSSNAVRTQLWISISMYVLIAIIKKRMGLTASLYTILQIASVAVFEKVGMLEALTVSNLPTVPSESANQATLFDL